MSKLIRKSLVIVLSLSMLLLGACKGAPETADTGVIRVISPGETVDLVSAELRGYLADAENYPEGDYTTSLKEQGEVAVSPGAVEFKWTFNRKLEVAEAAVLIAKDQAMTDPARRPLLSLADVSAGEEQSLSVFNLETGTGYYWCVEAKLKDGSVEKSEVYHFESLAGPRILNIDGVKNARDLGGWLTTDGKRTLEGLIYRTGSPDGATSVGMDTMLRDLGIKTEVDLRNASSDTMNSPLQLTSNYIVASVGSYAAFFTKPENVAAAIRVFADPDNYPILFNCAAGADRTGAIAFFLNALAGVPENRLIMDYELTPNRFRCGALGEEVSHDFPTFIKTVRNYPGDSLQEKVTWFLRNQGKMSVMEIYNIEAMMTGTGAVFTPAPADAVKAGGGSVTFRIDPRSSGTVEKILMNGETLAFTFENNVLTVPAEISGTVRATAYFTDGTEVPLIWSN